MRGTEATSLTSVSRGEYINKTQKKQMQTFLIIPTHLLQQLHQVAKNSVQLHVVYTYGPHVSVEALDKYEHVYWDGDGRWVLFQIVLTLKLIFLESLKIFSCLIRH